MSEKEETANVNETKGNVIHGLSTFRPAYWKLSEHYRGRLMLIWFSFCQIWEGSVSASHYWMQFSAEIVALLCCFDLFMSLKRPDRFLCCSNTSVQFLLAFLYCCCENIITVLHHSDQSVFAALIVHIPIMNKSFHNIQGFCPEVCRCPGPQPQLRTHHY